MPLCVVGATARDFPRAPPRNDLDLCPGFSRSLTMPEPFLQRFPGIASILRNGALLAGTQWAEAILRGLYVLIIGRWLGPELYGAWSYATTSYTFALGLTLYGLETLIPLRLGREPEAARFLGTTLVIRLGLLLAAAALFAAHALVFEADGPTRVALLLVLPALIGRGLVLWTRSALLGLEKSATAFSLAVRMRLFEVAAGLVGLWLGAGLVLLLAIHAVSWIGEAALAYRALSRHLHVPLRADRPELRAVLREGFVLGLVTISLAVLTAMPLILLRHLTGDLATVGQIGIALQVSSLAVVGAQGLLTAALPVVARATTRGDRRLRHYGLGIALGATFIFGIAILLAEAFGPAAISALLGDGFAPAGALLAPALLVGGLTVLPSGAWQVLVSQGRKWPGVVAGWSGVAALFATLPGQIESAGATGALTAAAAAFGLRAAILMAWSLAPARSA